MPDISLKDIQSAIKDSIGSDTYDNEIITECDIHSLIERRNVSCLAYC